MFPLMVPDEASVARSMRRRTVKLPVAPANRPAPPVMVYLSTIETTPGVSVGVPCPDPSAKMLARTLQDHHILAEALDFLGLALGFQKKFHQAHILLEESQSLSHASNNKQGIALTNWHLGWVVEDEGNWTAALEFQEQALAILEELGNIHQQSILLRAIGEKLLDRGELNQGSVMLQQALSAAYKVGSKLETGNAFMALSFAEEQQVNLRKAVQFLKTAQKLYQVCGSQSNLRDVEKELGRLSTQVDSSIFEAAIAEAQAWTMEQAVAYALESRDV